MVHKESGFNQSVAASGMCARNRLGQVSMKCKVVGIFGEKLVNIHFYII